jgi:hypothetical protein
VNTHEISAQWSLFTARARCGDISTAALAHAGRQLIASTSVLDLKAQRYLDVVIKPEVNTLEASLSATSASTEVAA